MHELPAIAPTDAQIRFAAKLARESQVNLQRMQSEPLPLAPRHLGQVRVALQLGGDYRSGKLVVRTNLALTSRHHRINCKRRFYFELLSFVRNVSET